MRLIRKRSNGEHFIETDKAHWDFLLSLWDEDHSRACPMPYGHMMFRKPKKYGCDYVADLSFEEIEKIK